MYWASMRNVLAQMDAATIQYLGQHSQYESVVGDHLFDLPLIIGNDRQDVWDEVSDSEDEEKAERKR